MSVDLTRKFNQKKVSRFFIAEIHADNYSDFAGTDRDFHVGNLPAHCLVTDTKKVVVNATNAGDITVGTTAGGDELLDVAGDSSVVHTGEGVPVYLSVATPPTSGHVLVMVEYIEIRRKTGELMRTS